MLPLRRLFCSGSGKLSKITKVWFSPLAADSKWIKPCCFHYVENGIEKSRDIMKIYDGVLLLVYNRSRQKLVFVRQFRASVYHGLITGNSLEIPEGDIDLKKYPPEIGVTLELCAGIVDKNKSLVEIAREELYEECGYDVPADCIQPIFKYRSGVCVSSASHTLFYCEVGDEQKVPGGGGGVHDEVIEVVELSVDEARELVQKGADSNGAPGLLVGVLWFLYNKASSSSA